jgi:ATP-dependent DNA ligase
VEDGPSPGAVIRLRFRKATLPSMLAKAGPGVQFNQHLEGDGPTVFGHACKTGLEGIVSKHKDSPYCSGALARLAQDEESGCASGEGRG